MKTRRLILIGLLMLVAAGRIMPMTLMPEPGDPWYLHYTTMWFIAAGFLLYPSALVADAVGLSFKNAAFLIFDLAWVVILCVVIYFYPFRATASKEYNS
jgi:hypothetical protein